MRTNFTKEEMKQRMNAEEPTPKASPARKARVIDTIALNIREKPNGPIITAVDCGTELMDVSPVLGTEGEWYHVRLPDGREGVAMEKYLKVYGSN